MRANTCPRCGGSVMSYGRFFREAEPTRISPCGSCGARLRRSRWVYGLLVAMVPVCGALVGVLFAWDIAVWLRWTLLVLGAAGLVLLTNVLGWLLVGWVAVEDGPES